MRSSSIFYSRFWVGGTGRQILRDLGPDHAVVAIHLFTNPHAHMSGIYWISTDMIAIETGIRPDRVTRILADLERVGFCRYDPAASMIWVCSMARWQISDSLRDRDNRVKGMRAYLRGLPRTVLVADFIQHYGINLGNGEAPSEGDAKPLGKGSYPTSIPSPSPSHGRAGRPAKKSGGAK